MALQVTKMPDTLKKNVKIMLSEIYVESDSCIKGFTQFLKTLSIYRDSSIQTVAFLI